MINLFQSELAGLELHCGTAIAGNATSTGRCKDSKCKRRTPMLLGGYCTSCAILKGMTPLKACGCEPIRLTEAAAAK